MGEGKLLLTTVFKENEQPTSEPVKLLLHPERLPLGTVSLLAGLVGTNPTILVCVVESDSLNCVPCVRVVLIVRSL